MKNLVLLLSFGTLLTLSGPGPGREFLLLTLISLGLLWLLPLKVRGHVAKVGLYAHGITHGLLSFARGGPFHHIIVHRSGKTRSLPGGEGIPIAPTSYVITILFGAVFLARSALNREAVTILYLITLLLAISTLKAKDLHTACVGNVVAATLGLVSMLFPNTGADRFLLNLMGVIMVWQGVVALRERHGVSLSGTSQRQAVGDRM